MLADIENKRLVVVGAGGVGGYLGGLLAHNGLDVTFCVRPSSVDVLKSKGLVLTTVDDKIVLPKLQVASSPKDLKDVDVVLLTMKTYDLNEVAQEFSLYDRKCTFITFQNGIDNDLVFRQYAPNVEVYPGVAYIISTRTEAGVIEQSAGPRKFLIGDRNNQDLDRLKPIALIMRSAGIDIDVSTDIEKALWIKFIWIIAFAGVTGACRSPIGPIVNDPIGFKMFERSVDEAISVARAVGVKVDDIDRQRVIEKGIGYKSKGGTAKSSLAADLDNNRKTEVEALHGTLVRLAHEVNIDVPVIESMYNSIRFSKATAF